ncbi:hypothetical protein PC116_g3771 [Phytophthora cactorum]|nr:hypothetical protein Pcac1_g24090 [Phytophthora cactorum]KAG2832082.1 hypothetical protein PC112_g7034 [Phytophthora cactorum]KAG2846991.1 hypothetical protein PC111_g995 [Phytophthora cactorum]KAG2931744.1 hypothetical protein PC114_g2080 [Phytophthora cactorum]KAG4248497.1 hypothetical protein PC116_g3771 [Phytophthora cactorum]
MVAQISASTTVGAETVARVVAAATTMVSDAKTCADDTGYSIYPFTGKPTEEQMPAIWASPTCTGVLQDAIDSDLPDCTIDFETTQLNMRTELTVYATRCGVFESRRKMLRA